MKKTLYGLLAGAIAYGASAMAPQRDICVDDAVVTRNAAQVEQIAAYVDKHGVGSYWRRDGSKNAPINMMRRLAITSNELTPIKIVSYDGGNIITSDDFIMYSDIKTKSGLTYAVDWGRDGTIESLIQTAGQDIYPLEDNLMRGDALGTVMYHRIINRMPYLDSSSAFRNRTVLAVDYTDCRLLFHTTGSSTIFKDAADSISDVNSTYDALLGSVKKNLDL